MEKAPRELETFGAIQRYLAQAAMQAVASGVNTPWEEFYLDIRSNPDGTARAIKFRVIPVSGGPRCLIAPKLIETIVNDLWEMRGAFSPETWYGMKLTISSKGQCNVDFNYDPNCRADPEF
jgi:hypothetical protein